MQKTNKEIVFELVEKEFDKVQSRYRPYNSSHEGAAIILEEVDEFWEEVKRNDIPRAREEAVQVAATALRYLHDVQDKVQNTELPPDYSHVLGK